VRGAAPSTSRTVDGNRHAIRRLFAKRIAREPLSGAPVAQPLPYSRTVPSEFDKPFQKFCFFHALKRCLRVVILISGSGSVSDYAANQAVERDGASKQGEPEPASLPLGRSLQLRVFGFRFLQDGNVGVGIFPQCEEVFVGCERPDASGVGIGTLRGFRL
jgi:hypothetical protein